MSKMTFFFQIVQFGSSPLTLSLPFLISGSPNHVNPVANKASERKGGYAPRLTVRHAYMPSSIGMTKREARKNL